MTAADLAAEDLIIVPVAGEIEAEAKMKVVGGLAADRNTKGDRGRSRTRPESKPPEQLKTAPPEPVVPEAKPAEVAVEQGKKTGGEDGSANKAAEKPAEKPAQKEKRGGGRDISELAKEVDWDNAPETEMARLLREALEAKQGKDK